MKLIHKSTGIEVQKGDRVQQRGKVMVITGWQKPTSPASTGRIHVCEPHQVGSPLLSNGFYPNVFDCEWIEREDRL